MNLNISINNQFLINSFYFNNLINNISFIFHFYFNHGSFRSLAHWKIGTNNPVLRAHKHQWHSDCPYLLRNEQLSIRSNPKITRMPYKYFLIMGCNPLFHLIQTYNPNSIVQPLAMCNLKGFNDKTYKILPELTIMITKKILKLNWWLKNTNSSN